VIDMRVLQKLAVLQNLVHATGLLLIYAAAP
jgi:hypothetical protein